MGLSMGGFCALVAARIVPVDVVLAFGPQWSVVPGIVPGEERWWSISGHPKFDKAGEFQGYRGSAKDITVEHERKLVDSRLAEFDSLTGLANRHRMDKKLESTLAAYKAAKRSCTASRKDMEASEDAVARDVVRAATITAWGNSMGTEPCNYSAL